MRWFWGGVASFAITLMIHVPLITDAVPGGILDHQAAPDGAVVDGIQSAWAADGLIGIAMAAMISDIIFILIYGTGCLVAGLHFRSSQRYWPSLLGWIVIFCGSIFLVSDLVETGAQLVQLIRFSGNDDLAGMASALGPLKTNTFIAAFLGVVVAQLITRKAAAKA